MVSVTRTAPPLLRLRRVECRRGDRTVLALDELVVDDGEVVAVLGPNGAGKSTLFRAILLLEPLAAGTIEVRGERVTGRAVAARRRMAGVFQKPHLFAGSVRDNVAFPLRARRSDRGAVERAVQTALERLGIVDLAQRDIATLSGGEAQRVALARAVACAPELLLLDEPMANLDSEARRRFRYELDTIVRGGAGAALLITHDAADAFALADRVVVLEAGRIVQAGSPAELLAEPATTFVAAFTGAEVMLDGIVRDTRDGLVEVELAGGVRLLAVAAQSLRPGARAHVAYRAEDVVLEPAAVQAQTSARNRIGATVAGMAPAGGLVRVRLDAAIELVAVVTRESAAELDLSVGAAVGARIKTSALRAFAAA